MILDGSGAIVASTRQPSGCFRTSGVSWRPKGSTYSLPIPAQASGFVDGVDPDSIEF